MVICHLKNAELKQNYKNTEGRVVFRGDIVKDDSEPTQFFSEKSSSASQMTAAKVMDVRARLPDCDGQASSKIEGRSQIAQHGRTGILVAFLLLPAGLLKVPLSLSDPGSPVVWVAH